MSQWFRLWEDMPTDPKWRVIAKRAERPLSEVLSVFVFMMTNAAQSASRGNLENWNDEDVAAALDMESEYVAAIRSAMQGKTLDGERLLAWDRIKGPSSWCRLPLNEWADLRSFVFERDNYACTYCGSGGRLECDHVVPVSRGGSNDLSNLATSCFKCNRAKSDKLISEWVQ